MLLHESPDSTSTYLAYITSAARIRLLRFAIHSQSAYANGSPVRICLDECLNGLSGTATFLGNWLRGALRCSGPCRHVQ
jgi:hypothetical protein